MISSHATGGLERGQSFEREGSFPEMKCEHTVEHLVKCRIEDGITSSLSAGTLTECNLKLLFLVSESAQLSLLFHVIH